MNALGHAFQTAADIDRRPARDPIAQVVGRRCDQILHITPVSGVAREAPVQPSQHARRQPHLKLRIEKGVVRPRPFPEQQPGPARRRTRLQMRPQARDAGAVADQDHRRLVIRAVEAAVGSQTHPDLAAKRQSLRQPARGQAGRPVGMAHQADQKLDPAVRRQGGDGIFARAGRGAVPLRQADLGDVAGRPDGRLARGLERQMPGLAARTAGIDQRPFDQPPGVVGRRGPVGSRHAAGDLVQLVLPVADGAGLTIVHLDHVEQGFGARAPQPAVDRMAEAAELVIAAVAQGQDAEPQGGQVGLGCHRLPDKAGGGVGRIALARRGDDQQGPVRRLQSIKINVGEGQHPRAHAAVAQRPRRHPGQFLGKPRLAGEGDQDRTSPPRSGRGHGVGTGAGQGRRAPFAPDRHGDQGQPKHNRPDRPQPALRIGCHPGRSPSGSSIMAAKAGVIRSTGPRSVRSTKWAARPAASA